MKSVRALVAVVLSVSACAQPAGKPGVAGPRGGTGGRSGGSGGNTNNNNSGGSTGGAGAGSSGAGGGTGGAGAGAGGTSVGGMGGNADAGPQMPGGGSMPAPTLPPASVVINEIMYHPVSETTADDAHEFVEIHNRDKAAVDIGGWKLLGDPGELRFTFPAGTMIAPGQFLIVAKSRQALTGVAKYALKPEAIVGEFTGELENGGALVTLADASNTAIDAVKYNDKFPWPIAADSFGAGERWFPTGDPRATFKPHQYMGVSLERISVDVPGAAVSNWAPSSIDGATPGKANSVAGAPAPVIVTLLKAGPRDNTTAPVRAGNPVVVNVQLSRPTPDGAAVEWFVDEMGRRDEAMQVAPMKLDEAGGGTMSAELPGQKDNTVVRYRIRLDKGTREILTPRLSDPRKWYTYVVTPDIASKSRVYHLYIEPDDWQKMWNNVKDLKRVNGCAINAAWWQLYPATLVYAGEAYDVGVRYQGSRYSRNNGAPFKKDFPFPHPTAPMPMTALSIRVMLPKYNKFEKRERFNLNKMYQDLSGKTQNCNLFDTGLGGKIYPQLGIPATTTRFVHLQVNGGYFHYYNEYISIDDELAKATFLDMPLGDLFKARGGENEGPFGVTDFTALGAACGYTAEYRYGQSYRRRTNKWKGEDNANEVKQLIEGFLAAKRAGIPSLRAYVDKTFDVPALLTYLAVKNYAIPKDDLADDYFLYRKLDGKWMVWPWDLDKEWGGRTDAASGGTDYANVSFNIGENGDRNNYEGGTNELKDGLIKAYRSELYARMKELGKGILGPDSIGKLVDELYAEYDPDDAMAAPAGVQCTRDEVARRIKNWAAVRIKGAEKLP